MEHRNRSGWRAAWFFIPALILVLCMIYLVIAYAIPYGQWKYMQYRARSFQQEYVREPQPCADADEACLDRQIEHGQRGMREWNAILRIQSPTFEVLERPDLIAAMRHADGTVCYSVDAPLRDVPDEELAGWLAAFGAKRFYDMAPFFLKARGVFDKKYHTLSPLDARIEALSQLKWHYFPLGAEWRLYNTAEMMARFSQDGSSTGSSPEQNLPDVALAVILPILHQHGEYFTTRNFFRLYDMAKAELHLDDPS